MQNNALIVEAKAISKTYRDIKVFEGLNFSVHKGEFVAIIGPNGCGKSTLISILSGLDKDFLGDIHLAAHTQSIMLFQNYRESLFPWLTVSENISYPLKIQGVPKELRGERVKELCKDFSIELPLEHFPYELSGGQQQLIALLRALIVKPDIIFMDEPFSSLDYETTLSLIIKLQEIWKKTGITMILVSHDIDEAVLLAEKVLVMSKRPMRIIKTHENSIPYPRSVNIMTSPEFGRLKQSILSEFINQVEIN